MCQTKKHYKSLIFIYILSLFVTGCGTKTLKDNYYNEVIQNICNLQEDAIKLKSITSFEWDNVYVFKPYTSKASVEAVLKCKPTGYKSTISDTDTLLYFVKGEEVVCCIAGSFDDLGFQMDYNFDDYYDKLDNTAKVRIEIKENRKFVEMLH